MWLADLTFAKAICIISQSSNFRLFVPPSSMCVHFIRINHLHSNVSTPWSIMNIHYRIYPCMAPLFPVESLQVHFPNRYLWPASHVLSVRQKTMREMSTTSPIRKKIKRETTLVSRDGTSRASNVRHLKTPLPPLKSLPASSTNPSSAELFKFNWKRWLTAFSAKPSRNRWHLMEAVWTEKWKSAEAWHSCTLTRTLFFRCDYSR